MAKNINNQKFGRLLVLEKSGVVKRRVTWLCLCDCGNKTKASTTALVTGVKKSCGCLAIEKLVERSMKHGLCKERIYKIWCGMVDRCTKPKNKSYKEYGGRGIDVCDEWLDVEKFLKDMGHPPKGLSIDRIDNDDGYYKENCRWATPKQQSRNRRSSKKWFIGGFRFETCTEAAEGFHVTHQSIIKWCNDDRKPDCYSVKTYNGDI